jgi:H+-transporting ATPase
MGSSTASAPPSDLEKLSSAELFSRLGTTSAGLSSAEAKQRLIKYGPNALIEKKVNPLLKLLAYFWGPIAWMIEAAAILSALVRHWEDLTIILVLLAGNAVVGFWEEYQAGNAIAALKARLALQARVKRDGVWAAIAAPELVPGDVVRFRLGDIVPADAKLIGGGPVEVDQSALTGESLPVEREAGGAVYSGSVIKQGEADALVYGTGGNTFFGRTASLVETAHTVSHFQRAVLKIGDFLIVIAIALVLLILIVALFRGDRMSMTLEFALVLTVAAIPVAMPAVLSVTMAVGARALAAKQAIVARLAAIEELAGMDVLCSDKTGTLTENKLTLGEPFALGSNDAAEVIRCAALASRPENADAIDLAVLGGLPSSVSLKELEVEDFQPFDAVRKRTEATVRGPDGKVFRVAKGAPQVILAMTANPEEITAQVNDAVNGFAKRGFRSLGVARADGDGPWRMLGVLPLYDPPRSDSKETIATARKMGVAVKMVTGDQVAIAKEIAAQLDLGTDILEADVLDKAALSQTGQLAEQIERADGFAQVFPEHKFHIVETLQSRGHIVGMTGDGVNDAPALKKADVGIAVTGATDAARAAAAIVLLAPGLSVIIDAIKESRKIFQRMNSYAIYRIAETIRLLAFMTLSILVFNFYPVTAAMIVLLALLNDGPILAIAYDRVRYSDKPEKWNMGLVLGISSVLGIAGVIASFGLFYLAERVFHLSRDVVQTFIFLKLAVAGHLTIFLTRTRGPFWSTKPAPILLWSAIATKVLATLAAVYGFLMTPIAWKWALLIWGYALVWFLVNDWLKLKAYKIFDTKHPGLMVRLHRWRAAAA